ncbi:hypothetical protein, conserved [Eimeria maxima]|uniref:Uncharacterized protein n=1 Tax=Eimeria maxima TaxID=5804 RepID=U6M3D0_EIMMA|nr:hypothetical protein, conserved [Eimeria maxima]CDJ57553.1 hypothetical protein, conserved [Eimeria maxima]
MGPTWWKCQNLGALPGGPPKPEGPPPGAPWGSMFGDSFAGFRDLFARTDSYFSQVGLLPLLLPLPLQGECGALKRGLLRSFILSSSHIHSSLLAALTRSSSTFHNTPTGTPRGAPSPSTDSPPGARSPGWTSGGVQGGATEVPLRLPLRSPYATPHVGLSGGPLVGETTGGPSGGPHGGPARSSVLCGDDAVAAALLPACMLREKLKILARELGVKLEKKKRGEEGEEKEEKEEEKPLLSDEELGMPALRRVLECIESSNTEGVLLLLCERRSSSFPLGPFCSSLDTILNASSSQLRERQLVQQQELQQQPRIEDLGLGVVAGGIALMSLKGQREILSLFCIEQLPDDARHQLLRVLAVRLLALGLLWPSVFCSSGRGEEDFIRISDAFLLHFPRPACEFFCLSSGLQLSRHVEEAIHPNSSPHTDQCTGCICIKRLQRKINSYKKLQHHKPQATPTPASLGGTSPQQEGAGPQQQEGRRGSQQPEGGGTQHQPEGGPQPDGRASNNTGAAQEHGGAQMPIPSNASREGSQGGAQAGSPSGPQRPEGGGRPGSPQGGPQGEGTQRGREGGKGVMEEEWVEFWAISKRRFFNIWRQRADQLVPETPAASLMEALDGPLRFPSSVTANTPAPTPSPIRKRGGGPRSKRARGGGTPSSNAAATEDRNKEAAKGRRARLTKNSAQTSDSTQAPAAPTATACASDSDTRCVDVSRPHNGPLFCASAGPPPAFVGVPAPSRTSTPPPAAASAAATPLLSVKEEA